MKVLLVDQIGHKTFEYDYAAAKHYSDDFEVSCYMSDNTPKEEDHGLFKIFYGFHDVYSGSKIDKGIKYIKALQEMRKCILENHFDIINVQWYDLPLYEKFFYRRLRKQKNAPKIVMTVHGLFTKETGIIRHYIMQTLYREADAILIHSDPGVKIFKENFTVKCPIFMITSAFRDEDDYTPINKEEAKRALGIPIEKKVVLSFGTIRESKSIDVLYKAFPSALNENPDLFLLSAGTLNVKDKDYYTSLADACRATGAAKIDFEYVPKEMEPIYYSAADILALPYSYISQSGVAYCGLLFHLPMIATDIPRLDLMAKGGINAEIFPKGDVAAMAKKMAELASDDQKLTRYAEGSERIRKKDFSIKRRVALTEQAYREIMK